MIDIQQNILLAPYTIYKIGGPARFFVEIRDTEHLREAVRFAADRNLAFFILGAGSNVLISDSGFDGLVMRMTGGAIDIREERMSVDAGVMMARAVLESGRAALHGFEWGIGVPGTIGGSIRGNAGCFGGEMKDIVQSVKIIDVRTQEARNFSDEECGFGYRDSVFKKHPEWIIVSAILNMQKGDREEIQQEIGRIAQERIAKQDIGSKSCGCIFKNASWPSSKSDAKDFLTRFPELKIFENRQTIPAAFLIDACGLKGTCIGGVCISDKHANFFINRGAGSSSEVGELIAMSKEAVRKKYGIDLQEEIHMIG